MPDTTDSRLAFLQGGGELAELIRSKDWSEAPLGPPETWPLSLRTTLGILLNSGKPLVDRALGDEPHRSGGEIAIAGGVETGRAVVRVTDSGRGIVDLPRLEDWLRKKQSRPTW